MKLSSIPQVYRHVNRWREILTVLSKYGLAGWIQRFDLRFAQGLLKDREGAALSGHRREVRIRLALTELGPTFVKLGQILSTRPDLVGVELAEELQKLQDKVPADPPEVVRRTIEAELGTPLEDAFCEFDAAPLASASIGQVHRARTLCGQRVVVKVQHPKIEHTIRVDLDILAGLAQLAEKMPELANYRPRATVAEFQRTLRRELDFSREARNMQHVAHNFSGDSTVHIPRLLPQLCTSRILTMELLEGVKLSEVPHCNGQFDLQQLARRGADMYLTMIFTHGFYHADPHPGNLVAMPGNVVGLMDFGMVGRIDEALGQHVEDMFLAIGQQDAQRLTTIITRLGEVPANFDHAALSIDVADFVAHYGNQPIDSFDLSGALNEMTEMIRRYQIMLPARIALLLKALVMLEGTARLLCPQFSLMEVMRPHQRRMLRRRLSPMRRLRKLANIYSELEHLAEEFPRRLLEIFEQVQRGKFDVHLDHRGLEPSVNRLVLGMLASALFLGSSLLLSHRVPPLLGTVSVLGVSGCVISLALGLRLLRAINKSGHLDRRRD